MVDLDLDEVARAVGKAAGRAHVDGVSRHRFAAGLLDEFFEETLSRAKQRY
jgi:hypothetical protein